MDSGAPAPPVTVLDHGRFDRPDVGVNLAAFRSVRTRSLAGVVPSRLATDGGWERVVVTGGSGCVGTAVLRLLQGMGVPRITSVSDRRPATASSVAGVEYVLGDVTDRVELTSTFRRVRPDLVIHLAAVRDPGRAERCVVHAVATNVVGTASVLGAAQASGVRTVVAASTGKAMRMFTSDVYASTKQLVEYQASAVFEAGGMEVGCARFTHIVDNSLILGRILRWARAGQPIALHGTHTHLYIQSAREAAELMMVTAALARTRDEVAWTTAMTDLGWPPVSLLGLAMDVVEATGSTSPITTVGYPPGYEEWAYPGTTDPLTAGDRTPLFSALEVDRCAGPEGRHLSVDAAPLLSGSVVVDRDLVALEQSLAGRSASAVRERHRRTCLDYLRLKLDRAPLPVVAAMARRGSCSELASRDHRDAHLVISEHLISAAMRQSREADPVTTARAAGDHGGVDRQPGPTRPTAEVPVPVLMQPTLTSVG